MGLDIAFRKIGPWANVPIRLPVLFGLLGPPLLVLMQLLLLRSGKLERHFKIYRRINPIVLAATVGVAAFVSGLIYRKTSGRHDMPMPLAFFGAAGVGYFLGALIEYLWSRSKI